MYVAWQDLNVNIKELAHRSDLTAAMTDRYLDTKPKAIQNWVS